MRFIRPIEVTPEKLVSSNVPETDYPAWVATTAYAIGAKVMLNHVTYEALVANTGRNPASDTVAPPAWLNTGSTNRWRMFDAVVGTLTTNPGVITVTIHPGSVVNSIALLNVQGDSVTVTVTDPVDGVAFTRRVNLVDGGVSNWYDWFFEEIQYRSTMVLLDLPAYGTANITVTIHSGTVAAVGELVLGKLFTIGKALYGTGVGIDDYSRKERDKFGNWTVVERAFSDSAKFPVAVETSAVARIKRMLAEIRAKPVVWVGEETYEATIVYGFFTSLDLVYSGPTASDCQLTIEGLL